VVAEPGDDAAGARRVAARARGAEVVYLGERHDNPDHHAAQTRVLQALLAGGARPAVGFEMLTVDQQAAVDMVQAGTDAAADAERRLRWSARGWPDIRMYWPLFELARRHRLRVWALDLDAALVRRIAREGLAAAGEQQARVKSLLPPDAERERVIARTIQEAHCNLIPEPRLPLMVESWHARNVAMARRLADALRLDRQVVVIIGRGHQAPGGLPAQLEALRPGTRQLVIELVEVGSTGSPDAAAGRDTDDVLWLTPAQPRADPCVGLRERLGGQAPEDSVVMNQSLGPRLRLVHDRRHLAVSLRAAAVPPPPPGGEVSEGAVEAPSEEFVAAGPRP
jgi:uncharacterized iron-regulated protein